MKKAYRIFLFCVALITGIQFAPLEQYGLGFLDLRKYDFESLLSDVKNGYNDIRKSDIDSHAVAKAVDIPNHPGFPSNVDGHEIVEHKYYRLAYNEEYEQPDWVMYHLTKEMLAPSELKRADDFRADPDVDTGSATPSDYKKTGYDRGHLLPAADMKFSEEALSETFFMSNMSPQAQRFNRGRWKELEEQVRDWAMENDELYIVVGPIYQGPIKYIGKNKVAVPSHYYKVILDLKEPEQKAIAFLMANTELKEDLPAYVVSIDSIEKITGIDFFADLPDDFENFLEGQHSADDWFDTQITNK